jgi:hypothetical protein
MDFFNKLQNLDEEKAQDKKEMGQSYKPLTGLENEAARTALS